MKKIIFVLLIIFCIKVNAESDVVTLNACVDGDTAWFNYRGERKKFRFLALDTPETVHPTKIVEAYGKDASEYTCTLLTNAKKIVVEFDEGSDKFDKYDRYLAWIWVDGELLQEKLISVGYGKIAYIYGDYMYTKSLCKIQNEAFNERLGIWLDEDNQGYCDTINYNNSTDIKFNDKTQDKVYLFDHVSEYPWLCIILFILVYILKNKKRK